MVHCDRTAFKENIFHFQFVILDLPLEEKPINPILPMTNLKLQIENEKCSS